MAVTSIVAESRFFAVLSQSYSSTFVMIEVLSWQNTQPGPDVFGHEWHEYWGFAFGPGQGPRAQGLG